MPKTIDPDAYNVHAYDTGAKLEGLPTEELVRESLAAGDSGAVCATYDSDEALWSFLRDDEAEAARQRGEHVRVVYVLEA
jgi:hypothetical protein